MGKNERKISLAIHILLADEWTKEGISRTPFKFKQTPFTLNETNSNIMNEQIAHCSIFHKLYFNQWDFHAPKVSPSRTSLGLPCADVHWSSWDRHCISHETSSNQHVLLIVMQYWCHNANVMKKLTNNWKGTFLFMCDMRKLKCKMRFSHYLQANGTQIVIAVIRKKKCNMILQITF